MKLELITLTGTKAARDVYEVILPTSTGEIAVFPGHEPLVTLAVPGAVSIRHNKGDLDNQLEHFAISGGVAEISAHHVRLLVNEAASGDEIVEEEARQALERARELRNNAKTELEIEQAQELIGRQSARIKVAGLHRRRHSLEHEPTGLDHSV